MRFHRYLTLIALLFMLLPSAALSLAAPPALQATPVRPFGVQMQGNINESQGVSAAVNAGTRWVRITMRWSDVEPVEQTPPQYNWAFYDAAFRNAANAGFNLIVTVTGNPAWAGINDEARRACGPIRTEKVPRFVSFMVAAVSRYGVLPYNVKNWEMYNEPDNGNPYNFGDLGGCWGVAPNEERHRPGQLNYPERYADLLRQVYGAVKTADPQAQVWFGGIAYDFFQPDGPFDPLFLDDVMAYLRQWGGTQYPYFDIFNYHYYPAFRDLWNPFGPDLMGKARYLRTELQNYSVSKPVALTEVGRPTEGLPTDPIRYSDALTARYVPKAFARGLAVRLSHVIWFTMVDDPNSVYKYGLLRSDGTPKPAYHAYRTTMSQISGADYVGPVTENARVEGYRFSRDGRENIVAWLTDFPEPTTPQPSASLVVTATVVRMVSHLGTETYISDGSTGDGDPRSGRIGVAINDDPIWLEINPPPTPTPTATPTVTPTPTFTPTLQPFTPTGFSYLPMLTHDYRLAGPTPTPWFRRQIYLPMLRRGDVPIREGS